MPVSTLPKVDTSETTDRLDLIDRFIARTTAASGVPLMVEDLAIIEQIALVMS